MIRQPASSLLMRHGQPILLRLLLATTLVFLLPPALVLAGHDIDFLAMLSLAGLFVKVALACLALGSANQFFLRKQRLRWTMLCDLLLFLVGAGVLAVAWNRAASAEFQPSVYTAQASIDGYVVSVKLTQVHPFLAEYDKQVEIHRDAQTLASFSLFDPGGFASIYVAEDDERLFIVDGFRNGRVLHRDTGAVEDMGSLRPPDDFLTHPLGTFRFVVEPKHDYTWVTGTP